MMKSDDLQAKPALGLAAGLAIVVRPDGLEIGYDGLNGIRARLFAWGRGRWIEVDRSLAAES